MNLKPFTFDRVVRLLIGLAVLVLLYLLLKRLSDVLLPFLIAWLLAYLLQPIVRFFQYKLHFKSRVLSVSATLLLFFGVIISIVGVLAPIVNNEVQKMSQLIVTSGHNIDVNSFVPVTWQHEIQRYLSHLNLQTLMKDPNIVNALKTLAPQVLDIVNGSLDFVLGLAVVVVVFLYLVFILLDFEHISVGMLGIIPPKYKGIVTEIITDLESGMNRYFRGQALIALIVAVLSAIGFTIIQLPLAIVLGFAIGLLTLVPYLKVIGVIPCALMGFLQSVETGQSYASILIGIFVVLACVQLLEDLFLVPRIMGKVTGLNPAIILLSLSIWGSLMGMVGMIIALPVTTLIISYYKRFVLNDESISEHEEILETEPEEDKNVEL